MRRATIAICLMSAAALALPQNASAQSQPSPTDKSGHSTGTTSLPETKGETQPQGKTGPINTTTGGAPAESPQGETPAGMQAAPDGSSKSIKDSEAK
ncbi:MAG: hypothetical protein WDN48_06865 [Pseudolabrys sp.]